MGQDEKAVAEDLEPQERQIDDALRQERPGDNFLVAAARRIANIVSDGALRRMPRGRNRLFELVSRVVSTALTVEALRGQPPTSKRFAMYMAVAFCVGRGSMRGLRATVVRSIKAAVRAAIDYQRLMAA